VIALAQILLFLELQIPVGAPVSHLGSDRGNTTPRNSTTHICFADAKLTKRRRSNAIRAVWGHGQDRLCGNVG